MAFQAYASFKGTKQGQFKGESTHSARKGKWSEVLGFEMTSEIPVDLHGGSAKGARTHFPIVVTKAIGAASPQLLSAHWTADVLSEVAFQVVDVAPGGQERVVQTITLTNATISRVAQYLGRLASKGKSATNYTITYEMISTNVGVKFPKP